MKNINKTLMILNNNKILIKLKKSISNNYNKTNQKKVIHNYR